MLFTSSVCLSLIPAQEVLLILCLGQRIQISPHATSLHGFYFIYVWSH